MSRARLLLLALLIAGAVALGYLASRESRGAPARGDASDARLAWFATAHQFGPVGYRDPAGAISPDGQWVAYSEGRFLRVRATGGGPVIDLPAGEAQIRNLSWHPDSRTILADGYRRRAAGRCDRVARTRRGLWADRATLTAALAGSGTATARAADLRQAAWSCDGDDRGGRQRPRGVRSCGSSPATRGYRAPSG